MYALVYPSSVADKLDPWPQLPHFERAKFYFDKTGNALFTAYIYRGDVDPNVYSIDPKPHICMVTTGADGHYHVSLPPRK